MTASNGGGSREAKGTALIRATVPGKLPAFIKSLLPEGWLAQVLHQRDEREALRPAGATCPTSPSSKAARSSRRCR